MDYYTLEWKKYIYDNYYHNICDENYKINQKYLVFKSDLRNSIPDYMNDQTKWLVMEDRDAYKKYIKNIIEEENKLTFSDELLKQEFSIYYNNKKEYINNESFLEKKFKKYQIVKLLSYNEELIQFKNRIEICALKLENEANLIFKKYNSSSMDSNELFNRIGDIDNIDYRLIALNKGQEKYKFLYQNLNITNEVNGFLYGYSFYLKQRADKYNIELMKEISFHDGRIIECSLNNDKFGVISFTDGFQDNIKWTFNLYNYIYNGKKPENGYSIISGGYGNYENYKFILTIDEVDLIAEKIDVIKSII